ncbi:MAG: hypothetical protein DRN17_04540 [Thermoplasmata archaeon]|nr:MAG: hypothetical protein DRN17_04540 [Thermoplasmata archaeon]
MKKIDTEGWAVKAIKEGEHTRGQWFTGNLYREAQKVASFSEEGTGGQMRINYLNEDAESDFKSLATLLLGGEYPEEDALLISRMVDEYIFVRMIKRERKKNTFFIVTEEGEDTAFKVDSPYSERVVKMILSQKGDIVIANEEFDVYPDGVEKVYRDE